MKCSSIHESIVGALFMGNTSTEDQNIYSARRSLWLTIFGFTDKLLAYAGMGKYSVLIWRRNDAI